MAVGKIVLGGHSTPNQYFIDGVEVTKEQYDERFPAKPGLFDGGPLLPAQTPGCWPMVSEAAAVHPKQIAEATENARRLGVPTEYDGLGRPIFQDRGHRREYLRRHGLHDKNGGYGD